MYSLDEMLNRIKMLKKEKGYTNEELAQFSNIPLGTLSKIMAGITKDPQLSNIIKIAEVLDVSADYLIWGNQTDISPCPSLNLSDKDVHISNNIDSTIPTDEQIDLLNKISNIDEADKDLLERIIDVILETRSKKKKK